VGEAASYAAISAFDPLETTLSDSLDEIVIGTPSGRRDSLAKRRCALQRHLGTAISAKNPRTEGLSSLRPGSIHAARRGTVAGG